MKTTTSVLILPFALVFVVLFGVVIVVILQMQNISVTPDANINTTQIVDAESQLVIVAHNQSAEVGKFGVIVQSTGDSAALTVKLIDSTSQDVIGETQFTAVQETKVIGNYTLKLVNNTALSSQILVSVAE